MARGDIVGGLKTALSRGESLQKAMQSFYNAGYKKEEIEEAARELQRELLVAQAMSQQNLQPKKTIAQETKKLPTTQPITTQGEIQQTKPEQPEKKFLPLTTSQPKQEEVESTIQSKPTQTQPPQTTQALEHPQAMPQDYYTPPISQQVVSSYTQQATKSKIDFVTILLVVTLIVLLGVLAFVFFFKSELVEFLNRFLE